jgi:hypothetical protein
LKLDAVALPFLCLLTCVLHNGLENGLNVENLMMRNLDMLEFRRKRRIEDAFVLLSFEVRSVFHALSLRHWWKARGWKREARVF